jgi:putative spermidine/putrescine transport system permease protein
VTTLGSAMLVLPLLTYFALFVLAPLVVLVGVSLVEGLANPTPTLAHYQRFFTERINVVVLLDTLRLAALTTVVAILLGYPMALLFLMLPARFQPVLLFLVVLPLLTSAVVRTFAWIVILGRLGVVNQMLLGLGLVREPVQLLYNEAALVVALAQIDLSLVVLPLVSNLKALDPNLVLASRSLGASHARTFWRVLLPLTRPGLLAGAVLVFTASLGAFVTQIVVGGGRLLYMPMYVYQQAINLQEYGFAAALALSLLLTVAGVLLLFGIATSVLTRERRA